MKKRLLVALGITTAVAGLAAVSAFASTARQTANAAVCVLLPEGCGMGKAMGPGWRRLLLA